MLACANHARCTRPVFNRFSRPGTRSCRTPSCDGSPPERWRRITDRALLRDLPASGAHPPSKDHAPWGLAPFPIRRCCAQNFRCSGLRGFTPREQIPRRPRHAHLKVSDVFEISQMRTTSVSRGFEGVGYDFCARLILLGVSGVGAGIECANVRADHKHSASAPGLGSRGARPE